MKLSTIFSAVLAPAIAAALVTPTTPTEDALKPGELLRITYYSDARCHTSAGSFTIKEKSPTCYRLDLSAKGVRIAEAAPGLDMRKSKKSFTAPVSFTFSVICLSH